MKQAGSIFYGLILRVFVVLIASGLYLQDAISRYLDDYFGVYLNNGEIGFLFLAAVSVVFILVLVVKMIAALFHKHRKPDSEKSPGAAPQPVLPKNRAGSVLRGLIVWVFILFCAVGLFLDDEEVGFMFLVAVNIVYVAILLVRLIVALVRAGKKPELQRSSNTPVPVSPQPAAPPSPPPALLRYCSACGAGLETGDRYCPKCGRKLPLPAPGGETA